MTTLAQSEQLPAQQLTKRTGTRPTRTDIPPVAARARLTALNGGCKRIRGLHGTLRSRNLLLERLQFATIREPHSRLPGVLHTIEAPAYRAEPVARLNASWAA